MLMIELHFSINVDQALSTQSLILLVILMLRLLTDT